MLTECSEKLRDILHLMLNSGFILDFPWVFSSLT